MRAGVEPPHAAPTTSKRRFDTLTDSHSDDWLARWEHSAGGPENFARLLRAIGVSEEQATWFCRERAGCWDGPMLPWIDDLLCWTAVTGSVRPDSENALCAEALFVGVELQGDKALLEPVWDAVVRMTAPVCASWRAWYADGAFAGMKSTFVARAYGLCQAVIFEFLEERCRAEGGASHLAWVAHNRKFVLEGEYWHDLMVAYPVMARQLTGLVASTGEWMRCMGDMLVRDAQRVRAELLGDDGPVRMVSVGPGLSDAHEGGRMVHVVTFEDGRRAVLKPRNSDIDRAWCSFARWFAQRAGNLEMHFPRFLEVEEGSYATYIDHLPCENEGEFPSFYRRAGFLCATTCLLFGSDFHDRNLVAHGPFPVLVDVETVVGVCSAERENEGLSADDAPLRRSFAQSIGGNVYLDVTKTNFLPFIGSGKSLIEAPSALTGSRLQSANRPWCVRKGLRGEDEIGYADAREYVFAFQDGFDRAFAAFFAFRDEFDRAVERAFSNSDRRLVMRSTAQYGGYLAVAARRACLADARVFEETAARLARIIGRQEDDGARNERAMTVARERAALLQRTVPHITRRFNDAASAELKRRWDMVEESDAQVQSAAIALTLSQCEARSGCANEDASFEGASNELLDELCTPPSLKAEDSLEELFWYRQSERLCAAVGDMLGGQSLPHAAQCTRPAFRYCVAVPAFFLEGFLGSAVVLAALKACQPCDEVAAALESLVESLEHAVENGLELEATGRGLAEGSGGVLRALAMLESWGVVLGDRTMRMRSEGMRRALISEPRRTTAPVGSLLYGEAGQLLALGLAVRGASCCDDGVAAACRRGLSELRRDAGHELERIEGPRRGFVRGLDGVLFAYAVLLRAVQAGRLVPDDQLCGEDAKRWLAASLEELSPCEGSSCEVVSAWLQARAAALRCGCAVAGLDPSVLPQPSCNDTLVFGNAGMLMALAETRMAGDGSLWKVEKTYRVAVRAALSSKGETRPRLAAPFQKTGLFFGDEGIVFSLLRSEHPDVVGSLFVKGGEDGGRMV